MLRPMSPMNRRKQARGLPALHCRETEPRDNLFEASGALDWSQKQNTVPLQGPPCLSRDPRERAWLSLLSNRDHVIERAQTQQIPKERICG